VAENGATTLRLMAMFDWDTPDMAEVYTRAAEQKRLVGKGMIPISLGRSENTDCYSVTWKITVSSPYFKLSRSTQKPAIDAVSHGLKRSAPSRRR